MRLSVFVFSFRGLINELLLSSFKNAFYGSRVPFLVSIFETFLHVLTPSVATCSDPKIVSKSVPKKDVLRDRAEEASELD